MKIDTTSAETGIVPLFGGSGHHQEKLIVAVLLEDALAKGYLVSVYDGGDDNEVDESNSVAEICAALFQTDEARIDFYDAVRHIGSVWLVHGNGPWEVISDMTANDATRALVARSEIVSEAILEETIEARQKGKRRALA